MTSTPTSVPVPAETAPLVARPSERLDADEGFDLGRECELLSRYLVGRPAPAPVADAYRQAHAGGKVTPSSLDGTERKILRLARRGGMGARLADVYSARFRPHGYLRRKLALMVALLESHGASRSYTDALKTSKVALVIRFFVAQAVMTALVPFSVLALWSVGGGRR